MKNSKLQILNSAGFVSRNLHIPERADCAKQFTVIRDLVEGLEQHNIVIGHRFHSSEKLCLVPWRLAEPAQAIPRRTLSDKCIPIHFYTILSGSLPDG